MEKRLLTGVVVALFAHFSLGGTATNESSTGKPSTGHHIITNLSSDYNVNEWPGMSDGIPTEVVVEMFVNTLGTLDAAKMQFHVDMFLRQRWNDKRLLHDSDTPFFTIMDNSLAQKLWKPDTYFENAKETAIHKVTMPNMLLRVHTNGDILYMMRVNARLSCQLDLRLYPFDSQICGVKITSYSNANNAIVYRWSKKSAGLNLPVNLEIPQFDIMNINISEHFLTHDIGMMSGNFSGLTATMNLRRQNGYHLLQTYIPTTFIVSISWVNFWLEPNSVPGRVALGVTTLLTLTTLSVGVRQSLPPVSYVKAIDVWIGMCMVMVFGALLEFTLVNYLFNKQGKTIRIRVASIFKKICPCHRRFDVDDDSKLKPEQPSPDQRNIELLRMQNLGYANSIGGSLISEDLSVSTLPPPMERPPLIEKEGGTSYKNWALRVDRFSRVYFPLSFLIFNLIYWPFFVYKQQIVTEELKNTFNVD